MIVRALLGLLRDAHGSAVAEMALVTPLMLILICGSAELGNYFMNEHNLTKAVRDGARFAARQPFTSWANCSTVDTTVRDNTRNVVMYGYMSGASVLTPNISAGDIDVTTSCPTPPTGVTWSGVYKGTPNGGQIVTVSATVSYLPILSAFGFSGTGLHLNASSEAAVTGL